MATAHLIERDRRSPAARRRDVSVAADRLKRPERAANDRPNAGSVEGSTPRGEKWRKAKKPLVVVTRKLPDSVETRMRELFDTRLNLDDKPMSQAELAEAVKTADVLVPTVTDRIDAACSSQAGDKLKLIANFGNGVDNIDVADRGRSAASP